MLDPAIIYEIMSTIIDIDLMSMNKAKMICKAVTEEMSGKLKPFSEKTLDAINFACAAISVYRFVLLQNLADESYESVKTGDVTVKRSYSSVLESAEKLCADAVSAITPYLKDIDFIFRTV